ncbi:MAG TPA: OsmC family protein [Thermoplasmata archaeon]|nr:OsmC family protein [Thermoplasmata archaeon]
MQIKRYLTAHGEMIKMVEVVRVNLREGIITGNARGKELKFYRGNPHSTEYLLAGLGGCLAFFLKTVGEKRGYSFNSDLEVGSKIESNRFSSIDVDLYIYGNAELEKNKKEIDTIVRLAEKLCVIKNAIATPINVKIHVGKRA